MRWPDLQAGAGVAEVVDSIVTFVEARHGADAAAQRFVGRLREAGGAVSDGPVAPVHERELATAVSQVCGADDDGLAAIGHAIRAAHASLRWQVDDGDYYAPGAPVGDGYRFGNMHTVLSRGEDFAMGLFLLVPEVDYRDHEHAAPEFYLNLTGPTMWRIGAGEWTQMPAGSTVWNPPHQVHATRSGSTPWLAAWAWLSDIDKPCAVVPSAGSPRSAGDVS